VLADEFGFDAADARRIWCFGPEGTGANLLMDVSKGVRHTCCELHNLWISASGVGFNATLSGRYSLALSHQGSVTTSREDQFMMIFGSPTS
jgi:hypothetical protein